MKHIVSAILFNLMLLGLAFGQERTIQTTPFTRTLLNAPDAATAVATLGVSANSFPLSTVTNVANAQIAARAIPQTNGLSKLQTLVSSKLAATNLVAGVGTVTGTAGQQTLHFNGTGGQFLLLGLGDQIYPTNGAGNEQYLITGLTNATQTIVVYPPLAGSHTADAFLQEAVSMELQDTVPRRVGGIANAIITLATYSVGNNGGIPAGIYFTDGADTSSIQNIQGSGQPNYLLLSAGIGLGPNKGGQFQIQNGSQYNDLVVFANDDVGIRGGFTNSFGGPLSFHSPINFAQPQTNGMGVFSYSTNLVAATFTVNGTAGDNTLIAATGSFAGIIPGHFLFISGVGYHIVNVADSTHIQTAEVLQGTLTGVTPSSVIPPSFIGYNNTPAIAFSVAGDGSPILQSGPSSPSSAILMLGNKTNGGYFRIVDNGGGDLRLAWYNQRANNAPFSISLASTAIYDAVRILDNGACSFKVGITNQVTGQLNLQCSTAVGTSAPDGSSMLDVQSTTKAFTPPRMTKAQRNAISSPIAGNVVYQSDNTPGLRAYNGTHWVKYTETNDD